MEPGKLYMERIDYNGPVSILILRLGTPRYVDRHSGSQPNIVLVRSFGDVVGANRFSG